LNAGRRRKLQKQEVVIKQITALKGEIGKSARIRGYHVWK
jgi:hypothetical protein